MLLLYDYDYDYYGDYHYDYDIMLATHSMCFVLYLGVSWGFLAISQDAIIKMPQQLNGQDTFCFSAGPRWEISAGEL